MSVKFKDYYATLGVKRDTSPGEVKQAYRRFARQYHPDLHPASKQMEMSKKFKEINEAYEVLSDPQKRAKYDQFGADWERGEDLTPPPERPGSRAAGHGAEDFRGVGGFSDFFETLFGRAEGRAAAHTARGLRDIEAELPISLEDAICGGERRMSFEMPFSCPRCGGLGRVGKNICPACAGLGETTQNRDVTVRLPKDLRDGSRIRLKGQGSASASGLPGDLYLRVRLLPHPAFKMVGDDLETKIRIMPWDAVLGGNARVPTPEGALSIRIPPGSHSGKRLRVPGRGLPKNDSERGDLYAVIEIDIPDKISPEQEKSFQKLRESK